MMALKDTHKTISYDVLRRKKTRYIKCLLKKRAKQKPCFCVLKSKISTNEAINLINWSQFDMFSKCVYFAFNDWCACVCRLTPGRSINKRHYLVWFDDLLINNHHSSFIQMQIGIFSFSPLISNNNDWQSFRFVSFVSISIFCVP